MRTVRGLPAFRFGVWVPILLIPAMLLAAEPRKTARTKTQQPQAAAEPVEFFPAIEEGADRGPLDRQGRRPLPVGGPQSGGPAAPGATAGGLWGRAHCSDAGAAVWRQPVGRQPGGGDPPVGNPGSTQALGMAPPPNLYQPGSATAIWTCPPAGEPADAPLGLPGADKRGPSARIPYEVKPLSEITDKPEVFELCRMISSSNVNMRMVQAAAWHVNNGLDWSRMLQRGGMGPFADPGRFTPIELLGHQRLTLMAQQSGARAGQERSEFLVAPRRTKGTAVEAASCRFMPRNVAGTRSVPDTLRASQEGSPIRGRRVSIY